MKYVRYSFSLLLFSLAAILYGQSSEPYSYKPADRSRFHVSSGGITIMPDRFLREYDPVTFFFQRQRARDNVTVEEFASKHISIEPSHPGEFVWIDNKTLEFRPVVPWPSIETFLIICDGTEKKLFTLLSPPSSISPSNRATDLDEVKTVTMTFPFPVSTEKLKKLVSFEITPLPGIDRNTSIFYTSADYAIKAGEQNSSGEVTYTFSFNNPIQLGFMVRTRIQLSDAEGLREGIREYSFSTKPTFKILRAGSSNSKLSISKEGSIYTADNAVDITDNMNVYVTFSSRLGQMSITDYKNLISFSPSPRKVNYEINDKQIIMNLDIDPDRMYKATINPTTIKDEIGRVLTIEKSSSFYFYSRSEREYISWSKTNGILERYGPQHVPLSIKGIKSFDLRIYKIDPVSKIFWPFPKMPVTVNESILPPGPGEEPPNENSINHPLSSTDIATHIKMLGSPHYSEVISVDQEKTAKYKTLDLKAKFERIAGKEKAGAYLIGFRELNGSTLRHYVKLLVTDLCLTTVTSKSQIHFSVTSYKTGDPLSGAKISLEGMGYVQGSNKKVFTRLKEVSTDRNGMAALEQGCLYNKDKPQSLRRVVISYEDDTLVLDADGVLTPEKYANNHWYGESKGWLSSLFDASGKTDEQRKIAGFVCTERPVYRPEDTVHIKGYIRDIHKGVISVPKSGMTRINIVGPSQSYEYNVSGNDYGSFSFDFFEQEQPTGIYEISVQHCRDPQKEGWESIANTTFRIDAYRIPKYEVKLHCEDVVANDKPFTVKAVASYYAGGKVTDADVRWRINSYPYTWSLTKWNDYITASSSRYSTSERTTERTALDFYNKTDDNGSATATIQPEDVIGGNPRKYIVEATVTDADEQTVTDTRQILSLPSFILGIKTKRYITSGSTITASVAAIGIDEKPVAKKKVHVVLKRMAWNSYLQESDFARGEPQYITEEEITVVEERDILTENTPSELTFSNLEPGVYIFDITSNDKLGRQQSLKVDLFLAGDKAVTWKKDDQNIFETVSDKGSYIAGEEAEILLKSPFQTGMALACLEAPDGSVLYDWIRISNGQGSYRFTVKKEMIPKVPVSFLLIRPRISDAKRISKSAVIDPGKPKTIANTTWITVNPDANIIDVELKHDKVAEPGSQCKIQISLKDWKGKPLSGEVALWLVDKAVLSLGKEGSINPLPNFIPSANTNLIIHDTRNMAFGRLADFETPGGDEDIISQEADQLITVRKNFKTVPYFNPSIIIGKSGTESVTIDLPDNLTQFAIRAIAVSTSDQFGFEKSEISVRLPVIVQPSLPRFLRIGDSFKAGGIARVVEGSGGAAQYSIKTEGLDQKSVKPGKWIDFTLPDKKAQPLYLPLTVLPFSFDDNGRLARDSVVVHMAVKKKTGAKGDAFRVSIPLLPDRSPVTKTTIAPVTRESPFKFDKVKDTPRPNTCSRHLFITNELAIIKVLTAMRYLILYPFGNTEQRISRAYPGLAYQKVWDELEIMQPDRDLERYINETLQYLEKVQTSEGLFSYFPGNKGSIQLTSYALEFLSMVKKLDKSSPGKYAFSETVYKRAVEALKRALRTDYSLFTSGYMYYERCAALYGLAFAGEANQAYVTELAMFNGQTDPLSQSRIYTAIHESGKTAFGLLLKNLEKELWKYTVFIKVKNREVFKNMQSGDFSIGAEMHGREINNLSGLVRAFSRENSDEDKANQLTERLISLGGNEGWGDTYANGLALLALHDAFFYKDRKRDYAVVSFSSSGKTDTLKTPRKNGIIRKTLSQDDKGEIRFVENRGENDIFVMLQEQYLPSSSGKNVKAAQEGFAVKRQIIYVSAEDSVNKKYWIDDAGKTFEVKLGSILEEHIQITNPKKNHFVAVTIPLAAGLEYLNPALKTASEDFTPSGKTTSTGSYSAFYDDRIVYYFEQMPPGTYDFYFRVRATTEGSFTQPPARAELMYQQNIYGNSPGTEIKVVSE